MCVIIDSCCVPSVFNDKDPDYHQFKPVFDWIMYGKGFLVYGGTKYIKELEKLSSYHRFILNLSKDPSIVKRFSDEEIDACECNISSIIPDKEFDDKHIAAMASVSKCRVICTKDARSAKYLKDKRIYPKRQKTPKLYTSIQNQDLLTSANIPSCYKRQLQENSRKNSRCKSAASTSTGSSRTAALAAPIGSNTSPRQVSRKKTRHHT